MSLRQRGVNPPPSPSISPPSSSVSNEKNTLKEEKAPVSVGLELRDLLDYRLILLFLITLSFFMYIFYFNFFVLPSLPPPPPSSATPFAPPSAITEKMKQNNKSPNSIPNDQYSLSPSSSSMSSPLFRPSLLPPSQWSNLSVPIPPDGHTVEISKISENPQILLIRNFCTAEEAKTLIDMGTPLLEPSFVSESGTGKITYNEGRTSYTHHFPHFNNSLVETLERRLAFLSGLPIEHSAGINFLRYQLGEFFALHYDSKPYHRKLNADGMRIYSNLLYLNDLQSGQGGETTFPYLNISIIPSIGMSIFWSNINAQGEMDDRMLHEGRPPKWGEKFTVNMFIKEGMAMNALLDKQHKIQEGIPTHPAVRECDCASCRAFPWSFYDSNYKPFWGERRAWHLMDHTTPHAPWTPVKSDKFKYHQWLETKETHAEDSGQKHKQNRDTQKDR